MERGSPEELAYLGGFFDGEGCIHIGKDEEARSSWGARHQIIVQVAQCSEFPLDRYVARWGGSIFHRGTPIKANHSLVWAWRLRKKEDTIRFCNDIRPYVILKQPQIDLCLEFVKTMEQDYNRWNPMPKETWDARERMYNECRQLKKTVPGKVAPATRT